MNDLSIHSMTGFGKGEASSSTYRVSVEIKSVNHRFLDVRIKLPQDLSSLEIPIRKKLSESLVRGSIDFYCQIKKNTVLSGHFFDENKIRDFIKSAKKISGQEGIDLTFTGNDFFRAEFANDTIQEDLNELAKLVESSVEKAIIQLTLSRKEEGKKLRSAMLQHLTRYRDNFKIVESKKAEFQKAVEEKILKKFQEYKQQINVEDPRFMQEVIFYLERMDVHEEIDRINGHLGKFEKILNSNGEIGRSIDFLLQELNRETNTIGSKSTFKEISEAVIQMKINLEKLREQALNIE